MQMLSRYGVVLLLVMLVSGCSVLGLGDSEPGTPSAMRYNECQWNRSSCMYEGKYEPGERKFAEEEARRLNQASLDRLRRSGIR